MLNNYQIKEVNDTEKGLIFKQILTQKTWSFAYLIELSYLGKLREVKEVITLYGRSVNQENKDFRNERYSVYQLFAELSHVVQERAEGPKAPSPGQRPGYNVCKPVALKGQKPYVLPGVLKLLPLQGDRFASVITQGDALG